MEKSNNELDLCMAKRTTLCKVKTYPRDQIDEDVAMIKDIKDYVNDLKDKDAEDKDGEKGRMVSSLRLCWILPTNPER